MYRLLYKGTIEQRVYRRSVDKEGLFQRVVDERTIRGEQSEYKHLRVHMVHCSHKMLYIAIHLHGTEQHITVVLQCICALCGPTPVYGLY